VAKQFRYGICRLLGSYRLENFINLISCWWRDGNGNRMSCSVLLVPVWILQMLLARVLKRAEVRSRMFPCFEVSSATSRWCLAGAAYLEFNAGIKFKSIHGCGEELRSRKSSSYDNIVSPCDQVPQKLKRGHIGPCKLSH
jgi:hypothetical protein